jgi:hypothetical protein
MLEQMKEMIAELATAGTHPVFNLFLQADG